MAPKVSEEYRASRRLVLLAHALHCFGRKGYAATTVDDLVRDRDHQLRVWTAAEQALMGYLQA